MTWICSGGPALATSSRLPCHDCLALSHQVRTSTRLSRTTRRVVKRIGDQRGQYWMAFPSRSLGADQVVEPTAECGSGGGVAITPERAADNERAAQILLLSGPPKPTRDGIGFVGEESLEGLASLEQMGGVTRAVTRVFSRATSQSPSSPNTTAVTSAATACGERRFRPLPQGRRDRG